MIKVIPSGSFDFGIPVASLVDLHSRGIDRAWMVKRASVLTRELMDLRPRDGHAFIQLISLGAQEAYGANRNGDGFPEKRGTYELLNPKPGTPKIIELADGLVNRHATFAKFGHVFKHHQNDDPEKKIGDIYATAYNPEMKRGELIIDVPLTDRAREEMHAIPHDWASKVDKLAQGKDIAFSMACKVAYDICSNCGNKSPNRRLYCTHLADHMSDLTKEGHQNFAINDVPDFFDISDVFRPADRIAYSLRKVASLNEMPVGGAALAEHWGLSHPPGWLDLPSPEAAFKRAAARKLADMEKQVDAVATGINNSHINQLHRGAPCGNIPAKAMETLKSVKLGEALQALGDAQILLGFEDFLNLVAETKTGSAAGDIDSVKKMLPGLYGQLLKSGEIEECVMDSAYDPSHTAVPRRVKDAVWELMKDHSFAPECVEKRAQLSVIRGPALALPTRADKQAAVLAPSSLLAKEYAKYQLAFMKAATGNQLATGLTTLLNYTNV